MNDELNVEEQEQAHGESHGHDPVSEVEDERPPEKRARGRRRELRVAAAEELSEWRHLNADEIDYGVEVVLTGDGIHSHRADASKVGAVIEHVGNLLRSLGGGTPYISNFAFGNSVHLTIEPSRTEASRAGAALKRARDLQAADSSKRKVEEALREAVPDVEIGAALAADILSAPIDEMPLRVAELGQDVAAVTRSLAMALTRQQVSVSVAIPRAKKNPTHLSAERARRVAEVLREVQEPTAVDIHAPGVLSMADALSRQFALTLDASWERPHFLKGKRVIRGDYERAVGEAIREQGLWGNRVTATIRVTRDAVISSSRLRPAAYRLVAVRSPEELG